MSCQRLRIPWLLPSLVAVSGALALGSRCEADWWTFEDRRYYEPLIAGVREPHVSALALAWASRMPFMIHDDDPRRVWDIDLGTEIPIFGWQLGSNVDDSSRVAPGKYGVGFWIPIDFHMIEDFADDSEPIVNTDYRFGGAIKFQHGLDSTPGRWISARLVVGHESTHLGDEFSIRGSRAFPRTFERINVSWEFLDLGVMLEDASRERLSWSVRGGVTTTLPFRDSYYSTGRASVTESRVGPVTPSSNWVDPYAGFEAEWERLLLKDRWSLYVSSELRWRSVYDYHKPSAESEEDRQVSVNLISGIRKSGSVGMIGRVSPFLRIYHGVNPHGQFRNQADYTEFGVGLRLVR